MRFDDETVAETVPRYGDEVLCANWQPLAAQLVESARHRGGATAEAAADPEALLARVYRCQQA